MADCGRLLDDYTTERGRESHANDERLQLVEQQTELAQRVAATTRNIEETQGLLREINATIEDLTLLQESAMADELLRVNALITAVNQRIAEIEAELVGGPDEAPPSGSREDELVEELATLQEQLELLLAELKALLDGDVDPSGLQPQIDAWGLMKTDAEGLLVDYAADQKEQAAEEESLGGRLLAAQEEVDRYSYRAKGIQSAAMEAGCDWAAAPPSTDPPPDPVDEDPVDEDPVDEDPVDEDPVDEDPVDEDQRTGRGQLVR